MLDPGLLSVSHETQATQGGLTLCVSMSGCHCRHPLQGIRDAESKQAQTQVADFLLGWVELGKELNDAPGPE